MPSVPVKNPVSLFQSKGTSFLKSAVRGLPNRSITFDKQCKKMKRLRKDSRSFWFCGRDKSIMVCTLFWLGNIPLDVKTWPVVEPAFVRLLNA